MCWCKARTCPRPENVTPSMEEVPMLKKLAKELDQDMMMMLARPGDS